VRDDITPERVAELYLIKEMSVTEIAEHLQANRRTVHKRLADAGVEVRPRSDTARLAAPSVLDPLQVAILYHGQGMSALKVSELLYCSPHTVTKALRRSGQPVRPRGTPEAKRVDPLLVAILYHGARWGTQAVGEWVGVSAPTVAQVLRRSGQPVRLRHRYKA
jgi:transposase